MYRRQEPADLINKNIMKDEGNTSPVIIQQKIELEKQKTQDALNKRLSHRPEKVDLKLRNILRGICNLI